MSTAAPTILTANASLRKGSYGALLLAVGEAEIVRLGGTVRRLDLAPIPHYSEDLDTEAVPPVAADLRAEMAAADGILLTTPAYNGAVPGALKDAIDWASRPLGQAAFRGRPIAVVTHSVGPGAGMASADYLKAVLAALGGRMVAPITSIAKVTQSLDADGVVDAATSAAVHATAQALMLTAQGATVVDNGASGRFELMLGDTVAGFADYRVRGSVVELPHTETDPAFRGQGVAAVLIRSILDTIAANGQLVLPTCSYVATFIAEHPAYSIVMAA
jgi:chromate reductase, NAD(P)H dehydrogenase (quinone)